MLILYTSKITLKILQARLQQYVNWELPDVQSGFRKSKETRDQIADISSIMEKASGFYTHICFCFVSFVKSMTVQITTNCEKFLREWEYQTTLFISWEACICVKKQQVEPYWNI